MVLRSAGSPFTPELDTLVHEQLEKWNVPGLTISIVHGFNTYSKAYGIAKFPNKKMTPSSLFSTCSTTKAFTAAAMSLAIDDSQNTSTPVSWTTPLASIIREDFVLDDKYATANTTIEDALSHRSGLPAHEVAMMIADPNESLRHEVRKLRHFPLASAPRTKFHYCNHIYMVVSYAFEKLVGQDLGTALRERIWTPLDMKQTYFDIDELRKTDPDARERLVRGYTWVPDRKSYFAEPHLDYAPTTGAGSMVSNVLDYAKWVRSLIYRPGPMSEEGYTALFTPRSILTESGSDGVVVPDLESPYRLYALGWFVDQVLGERLYWHSGSWPGFGIMVGFIPDREWGFAMMGNAVHAREVEREVYMYLIERLVGGSQQSSRQERPRESDLEGVAEAKERLYPVLPDPPIPHALPLSQYSGVYKHPGYGSFELFVQDGKLKADLTDRVGEYRLLLEHASGEFFVCVAYIEGKGTALGEKFKTEFYVDVSGTATRVGLDLEPALGGKKIWFGREGV